MTASSRLSIFRVIAFFLLVTLAFGVLFTPAWAKGKASIGDVRSFYLSINTVQGDLAYDACADGYHFAGVAEIWDTSNLFYDSELGITWNPLIQGPPAGIGGWIDNADVAPNDNCWNWSTNSPDYTGIGANIRGDAVLDGKLWNAFLSTCDAERHVWCVSN
jgi:hypothetical protein